MDYVRIDGAQGGRDFLFGTAYIGVDWVQGGGNFLFGIAYLMIDRMIDRVQGCKISSFGWLM
jgi:hypothetical protein